MSMIKTNFSLFPIGFRETQERALISLSFLDAYEWEWSKRK